MQLQMSKIKVFFRLPLQDRLLMFEAVFWFVVIRLIIYVFSFRNYFFLLGKPSQENYNPREYGQVGRKKNCFQHRTILSDHTKKGTLIARIGSAVERTSHNVPWSTRCFIEAIVAKRMLKRRGFQCTIYLGLTKKSEKNHHSAEREMTAHAWIRCGDYIVTGKQGVRLEEYTVISSFK